MRRLVLLISICLICLVFCSCGESESKAPTIVSGEMTAVTNDSGKILGYECKYLDDEGRVTRWDIYNADQVYQKYLLYEYNDDGKLLKETSYRADGIGEYYYTYEYDENGTLREKGYYTQSDGSNISIFDENGFEVEKYVYDKEDKLTSHTVKVNGVWVAATEPAETEAETTK